MAFGPSAFDHVTPSERPCPPREALRSPSSDTPRLSTRFQPPSLPHDRPFPPLRSGLCLLGRDFTVFRLIRASFRTFSLSPFVLDLPLYSFLFYLSLLASNVAFPSPSSSTREAVAGRNTFAFAFRFRSFPSAQLARRILVYKSHHLTSAKPGNRARVTPLCVCFCPGSTARRQTELPCRGSSRWSCAPSRLYLYLSISHLKLLRYGHGMLSLFQKLPFVFKSF